MPVHVTFSPPAPPPGVSFDDPYLIQPALAPGTGAGVGIANSMAIQSALDALPIRSTGQKATLLFPIGAWRLDDDIFGDMDSVDVVGYGADKSILQLKPQNEGAVFRVGMKRGPAPSSSYWVDSFGLLDANAAPSAGVRWGYDLHSAGFLAFPGSGALGMALGDKYAGVNKLTIEMAIWGPPPTGPIVGAAWGLPDPWIVKNNGSITTFSFTIDPTNTVVQGTRCAINIANWSTAPSGQLNRFTFQIDLSGTGPPMTVWINGLQVSTPGVPATVLGAALGQFFRASTGVPWMIGASSPDCTTYSGDFYSQNVLLPLRIHGLRVSTGLRYVDNGNGTAMTRVDAGTINDLRFFTTDATTIAVLPMNETPASCIPKRRIPLKSQTGTCGGMLQEPSQYGVNATSSWTFRDIGIRTSAKGEAITLSATLNTRIERCKLYGGVRGLSTWQWFVNYPIDLIDSTFEGSDCPLFFYYSTKVMIRDAAFTTSGRVPIWAATSTITVQGAAFTFGAPIALIVGRRGSTVICERMLPDIEGGNAPTVAPFIMESGHAGNGGMDSGGLSLRDFFGGTFKSSTPFFRLLDGINNPGSPTPARLDVSGQFILHSSHTALAETQTATGWEGTVSTRAPWTGYTLASGPGAAAIVVLP